MQQFAQAGQGVVAIDGKTMRRSFDRAAAASPLHLVGAWVADARLCLGQLAVGDKSNEIVAVPKLLELLSLKGRIVTANAMSCQRKIAQQVIDQGAITCSPSRATRRRCTMTCAASWTTRKPHLG